MNSLDWEKELTDEEIVYYQTLTTPYFLLNLDEKAIIRNIVVCGQACKVVHLPCSSTGIAIEPCLALEQTSIIRLSKGWVRPKSDPDYVEYKIYSERSRWRVLSDTLSNDPLYSAAGIVGFAGIQYDDDKEWRGYGQIGTPKRIRFKR